MGTGPVVRLDGEGELEENGGASRYRAAIQSFAEVAHAIRDEVELVPLLSIIARKICRLIGVSRCSIYLRDDRTGLFVGQVSEVPTNAAFASELIKRLTCGREEDRFTAQILRERRPVLVTNAKTDLRPNRTIMTDWNVCTMLGVPMIFGQEVIGLMFVDNEDVPHDYASEEQNLAATFANLAAIAITQVRVAEDLRSNLETVAHQNNQLRRSALIEDRLTELVLTGAGLMDIADAVSALTGKAVSIHDASHRRLAAATPLPADSPPRLLDQEFRDLPEVIEALAVQGPKAPVIVGPLLHAGLPHRFLLAPIRVRKKNLGHVVIAEHPTPFRNADSMVARRAATIVALELAAEEREAAAQLHARDALSRDLILATDEDESLDRRARYQGLQLDHPHVVCLVADTDGVSSRLPSRSIYADFPAPASGLFATRVADGLVALIEVPTHQPPVEAARRVRDHLAAALAAVGCADSIVAGVSTACRGVSQFPAAYSEARQVTRCLENFRKPGTTRVLSADDLGPGRLFLSAASREEAERFLTNTLGPLLDDEDKACGVLLSTLAVFFDSSTSVRQAALSMAVHENTIRYRLNRICKMTGRNVSSHTDDQLTCQLALLILRLQGRLAIDRG
jgi:sugar diacid utilization regulator